MIRIAGVSIPLKMRLLFSLQKIYGIGKSLSHYICVTLKLNENKKVIDLNEKELMFLRNFIKQNIKVEGELRKEVLINIKRKKEIRSYVGMRHVRRLPVRGQNTHSNAKTRKRNNSVYL